MCWLCIKRIEEAEKREADEFEKRSQEAEKRGQAARAAADASAARRKPAAARAARRSGMPAREPPSDHPKPATGSGRSPQPLTDAEIDAYLETEIKRLLEAPSRESLRVPEPVPLYFRGFLEEGIFFARTEFSLTSPMLWKPLRLGNGRRIWTGDAIVWMTCPRNHQMQVGDKHIDPKTGKSLTGITCPKCKMIVPHPWYLENWRDT